MTDIPAKAAVSSVSSGSLLLTLMKARTFIALIAVLIFFSIAAPNFLSTANLILMSKHVALNAFLAMGMTFVIITGGIDLSVGSIVGLCGMVAGYLVLNGIDLQFGYTIYFNVVEIALITLAVGILIGAVNGLLITRLNVAPFIATLGVLYVARGLALLSSDGRTFPNLVGKPELGTTGFGFLGAGRLLGLPVAIWILIVVALAAAYLAKYTPLGRHIFAVGGNERASRISGVRVNMVKMFVYMFSGFCAAIVGLIISSELMASHPATGESFELNAIAAAVLGGTSMSGGRGTIGGTIVGAFVIGILSDGLVMMGVSSFWQMVIKGLVIIVAVVVDQAQRRLQSRVTLMQMAKAG
ncbi:ABC transporter permease [Mesorhizobium sp. M1060]|jgi:erythritol transport system permease protein|uniref:ABC transporter permease n=1 Tax=unclassified Mesorhizobium TaxID=325217 RepID=UPI0003CEE94B|nr:MULTISPECIES: ABC transporter permease [unclassified Mesorhizobium]ESW71860.1 sugar ABC transporter permease [Mesorhizobium sp. LSJC277A00]ESX50240.1 sugar ABC transporter permease [Mesorhizobium sp. LSHC426A00]ESX57669.1 sugar ABC transporter permease [Mesorhizobium sp. LSHC424B00]ESX62210.1 sugar ABC transporter permease [Mesorhizobium sp. LSHC422A00]ESX74762.1 sugar ABC transporter permease [Mesorhizobium sp. LSHC416B00]